MMTEIKFKMKVALQQYYVLGVSSVPYLVIINYTFQDYKTIMEIIHLVHTTRDRGLTWIPH